MDTPLAAPRNGRIEKGQFFIDQTWKGVYRVGGIALALAGVAYLIGSTIGFQLGTPPGNSQAFLQSLAGHPAQAQLAYWLFLLADIAFIPGILGLYLALKEINKSAMLIATAWLAFFYIMDLVISELHTLVLITLTQSYASTSSEVLRAAYQAAEAWGLATLPIGTFFSWVGPSSAYVIVTIVMLKSAFGRYTALLGLIVNALAVVCSIYYLHPILVLLIIQTPVLLLYGVWLIATGRRLFKFGG